MAHLVPSTCPFELVTFAEANLHSIQAQGRNRRVTCGMCDGPPHPNPLPSQGEGISAWLSEIIKTLQAVKA